MREKGANPASARTIDSDSRGVGLATALVGAEQKQQRLTNIRTAARRAQFGFKSCA